MKAPCAKRGNGCSNFERKSGLEKWIGIAGACASNCKVSGVGEHSTSIETCSASYHSYGSHITRIAAKGTSPWGGTAPARFGLVGSLPEKACLDEATATAVCEVPPALAARNGLTVSFSIA